jgi:hypothetical protein
MLCRPCQPFFATKRFRHVQVGSIITTGHDSPGRRGLIGLHNLVSPFLNRSRRFDIGHVVVFISHVLQREALGCIDELPLLVVSDARKAFSSMVTYTLSRRVADDSRCHVSPLVRLIVV